MANWRSEVGRRPAGPGGGDVLGRAAGWVWPYWLERQLDPESPAFLARGHLPAVVNVTQRNWTLVGNLASPWRAVVDPRGLVTPWPGGWSLDWWIGAEDRWHLPSREAAVRQGRAESTPVVETAMRIPGGDAVERVYAVPVPAGVPGGPGEVAVVEVENRSAVPVAVAFAVRPCNPHGLAPIEAITLDGTTVLVDGRPAVLLPRPPAGVAASTLAAGDCLHQVAAGQAGPDGVDLHDQERLGQAAFIFPLPHRTTVRVALLPKRDAARGPGLGVRPNRRRIAPTEFDTGALPAAADVVQGWQAHLRRGLRLALPDSRLQAAVDANRADLLLFHTGGAVTPAVWNTGGGTGSFLESAAVLATLDRFGFHAEAAEVLRAQPWRAPGPGPASGSGSGPGPGHREAHAGAVWAIAEHHRLTADGGLLGELIPAVRESVRLLVGAAPVADRPYESVFWSVRALVDGAWLLRLAGDGPAAEQAEAAAARERDTISAALDRTAARLGRLAMPAGPDRPFDARMIGSLVACSPLGLLPPDDPWVAGTLDLVRELFCPGLAFYDGVAHTGLAPSLTLRIARCELEAGDPRAWRRFRWMLDSASPTFTWPEAVHPRLGGGSFGDGHHGGAAAAFLGFVRQVTVRETPAGGLALVTPFPPDWAGQPLEVHDAPTHHGRISYALRWHGDRPALLWQCERPGVTLTVPGLDPSFSTTDREGEALLAPHRVRIPIPLGDADRT